MATHSNVPHEVQAAVQLAGAASIIAQAAAEEVVEEFSPGDAQDIGGCFRFIRRTLRRFRRDEAL